MSQKLLNIAHNIAFVEELEDFDEDHRCVTLSELKNRFKVNQAERLVLGVVFLIENVLLCLPLSITCSSMTSFYKQLSMETRLLPDEMKALTTCRSIVYSTL